MKKRTFAYRFGFVIGWIIGKILKPFVNTYKFFKYGY